MEVSPNVPRWLQCGYGCFQVHWVCLFGICIQSSFGPQLHLFFIILILPCHSCSSLGYQPPEVLDCLIGAFQVISYGGCSIRHILSNGTGGVVSVIVTGVCKLAATRFSRWQCFLAAFFERLVSMVTKKGKCHPQGLKMEMTQDGGGGGL